MKRILYILCICLSAAALSFGCSKTENGSHEPQDDPSDSSEVLIPPVLRPGEATDTSLTVLWTAVEHADGYVYKVNEGEEYETELTEITVGGLEPSTLYTVSVKAVSSDDAYEDSGWSSLELLTAADSGPFTFSFREEGNDYYCKVTPEDPSVPYYFYYMTEEQWNSFSSPQEVIRSKVEEVKEIADALGTTYPEILQEETITYEGEQETVFPSVEYDKSYVAYAFEWLDDGTTGEIVWEKCSKKFPELSSAGSVDIRFTETSTTGLHTLCVPGENTECYYQLLGVTAQVQEVMAGMDEVEFIKEVLLSQQSGILYGEVEEDWINLEPGTSYTLCVVGYDTDGNIFLETAAAVTNVERIESELFDELVGEWQGVQTFMDGNGVTTRSEFTMTIATSEGDNDYRMWNQLICKLDGYTCFPEYGTEGIPYYSPLDLVVEGFPVDDAYRKFGPKLIMTINAQEQIRIDADGTEIFYGWSELGDVFMMGADEEYRRSGDPLTVLHPSSNTLTIRCDYQGYYPSLFTRTDTGWMIHYQGVSDISLFKVD